jgi:hypothetical protein
MADQRLTRAVATRQGAPLVTHDLTVDQQKVLQYLNLNPTDPKSHAVIAVCNRYGLDPLLKHVVVIPKSGPYVTRDAYLHVAHESGQLDGIVVEDGPRLSEDGTEWVCTVSVHRKDMSKPFTFPGRYPLDGQNRQYGQEMALKSAESHALRRAFDIAGLPSLEELRPSQEQPSVTSSAFTQQQRAPVAYPGPAADVETGEIVDPDESAREQMLAEEATVEQLRAQVTGGGS